MYPPSSPGKHQQWTRDGFAISTDSSLIDLPTLNKAFASDFLYWAKALPEDAMKDMLQNSLNFGLYAATGNLPPSRPSKGEVATNSDAASAPLATARPDSASAEQPISGHQPAADTDSSPALIGFARLITDNITFAYLTDVYVLEEWRGQKLGEWLICCVQEVLDTMPWLRRSMAILGDQNLAKWYQKHMGMKMMENGTGSGFWVIQRKGRGSSFG